MKQVYKGKTKNVYALEDGNYLLQFKDDVTGENGVFDPGANQIGLSIDGMGKACLQLTDYFFRKIADAGIPTHYIASDIDNATMTIQKATPFGKGAILEIICRFRATGSFLRRYGLYTNEGDKLDALVEVTLKDDARQDPLITKDALAALDILSEEEYEILKNHTKKIANLIREDLASKGLELYDIKLEFGRAGAQQEIILVDEISAGNMRVYKDGKIVEPMELVGLILA